MPLLLKGLSAALRRDAGPELHAGKRGEFGAGQGGPIPERFVGTTSKLKVPRERREDGPAAAEVRWPALRHARPEKKLPRLTVTAFTNLILTDQHYRTAGLSRFIFTAAQARYSFFSSSSSLSSFTGVLAVSRNGDCCQRVRRWRSRVRERIMPIASASSIIRRRILVVLST